MATVSAPVTNDAAGAEVAPSRAERLYALTRLLQHRRVTSVEALAQRFGVSRRTLLRDLATLRAQGVPIDGRPGRGGGLYVRPGWQPPALALTDQEAAALWLSVVFGLAGSSPEMVSRVHDGFEQVVAALPATARERVRTLGARLLVGPAAGQHLVAAGRLLRPNTLGTIGLALADERAVVISYVDAAGVATERTIEPHALLVQPPLWYLLAFDTLRDAPRTFRLDRVESARATRRGFLPRDPRTLFPDIVGILERAPSPGDASHGVHPGGPPAG